MLFCIRLIHDEIAVIQRLNPVITSYSIHYTKLYDNGYCKILELIDGGPAKKSGNIKEGDTIVGVAQGRDEFEDVIGKRLRDIVRLIRNNFV